MIAYVILQKGFEYNDEVYSQSGSGAGHPHKIFFTKEAAREEVVKMNINEFKQTNITEYSYEIEDICDDPDELLEFCNSLNEKYGEIESKDVWNIPDEYRLHNMATDEEANQYSKMVDLDFYEMVEVEVDQQDLRESKLNQII
jgi:hypothetical protein